MFKIGFTGTQRGMTDYQKEAFKEIITAFDNIEFHHGDCIGADLEAHIIVQRTFLLPEIHIHPPINDAKRAFCKGDHTYKLKNYIDRNKDIVNMTDIMVAVSDSFKEKLRSGTWSTVRYAINRQRPVTIIYPNGDKETK